MGWLDKYNAPIEAMLTKLRNMSPNPKESEKDNGYIINDDGDYIPNLYFFDTE